MPIESPDLDDLTYAEIVERASLLRIPVAPVNSGRSVFDHVHLKKRGVFKENPSGQCVKCPKWPLLENFKPFSGL